MKQDQNTASQAEGPWGVRLSGISKAVSCPPSPQFFAFITALLYILHAFSIYYH